MTYFDVYQTEPLTQKDAQKTIDITTRMHYINSVRALDGFKSGV